MMAMSLYGGDHNSAANANPYLAPHALHHGKLARNPIELQARSLPRPRKSRRKKRETEKPLYPSIAAVEEAVPEAIISVQDNGTLDIRLPHEEESAHMEEEEEEEEEDRKPAAATAKKSPSSTTTTTTTTNKAKPYKLRSSTNSSSLLGSRPTTTTTSSNSLLGKPRRRSSNSSEKLDQAFRKLSVKRKPQGCWSSMDIHGEEEDDPLSTTLLTLAPRRKVSRQGSRDSLHSRDSRASADSGDSSSVSSSMSSVYLPTNPNRQRMVMPEGAAAADAISIAGATVGSDDSRIGSTLDLNTFSMGAASMTTSKKKSARARSTMKAKPTSSSANSNDAAAAADTEELEIEPGIFLPLRGCEETMAAIQTGFVEEIFCQACDIELICIADASYCVCPDCKCVSPVDGIASFQQPKGSIPTGSVGLGLRASSQR